MRSAPNLTISIVVALVFAILAGFGFQNRIVTRIVTAVAVIRGASVVDNEARVGLILRLRHARTVLMIA